MNLNIECKAVNNEYTVIWNNSPPVKMTNAIKIVNVNIYILLNIKIMHMKLIDTHT